MVEYADVTWCQMWAQTYNSERQQVEDRYGDRKPLNGEFVHFYLAALLMLCNLSQTEAFFILMHMKIGTGGGTRKCSKKSIVMVPILIIGWKMVESETPFPI